MKKNPLDALRLLAATMTLLLAYASWHLVEKKALRFKPGGVPA